MQNEKRTLQLPRFSHNSDSSYCTSVIASRPTLSQITSNMVPEDPRLTLGDMAVFYNSITLSQHNIAVVLYQQTIISSDHRLLCHARVDPPIAYLRIGSPREICIDANLFP